MDPRRVRPVSNSANRACDPEAGDAVSKRPPTRPRQASLFDAIAFYTMQTHARLVRLPHIAHCQDAEYCIIPPFIPPRTRRITPRTSDETRAARRRGEAVRRATRLRRLFRYGRTPTLLPRLLLLLRLGGDRALPPPLLFRPETLAEEVEEGGQPAPSRSGGTLHVARFLIRGTLEIHQLGRIECSRQFGIDHTPGRPMRVMPSDAEFVDSGTVKNDGW